MHDRRRIDFGDPRRIRSLTSALDWTRIFRKNVCAILPKSVSAKFSHERNLSDSQIRCANQERCLRCLWHGFRMATRQITNQIRSTDMWG